MAQASRDLAQASALLDVKRFSQAASLLARIVAADPSNSRAWCMLAAAQLGNGQHQEAVASARRAVMLAPSDDWPYRLLSIAQRHVGKITAAVTAANEACKLAPHQWRTHVCLAQAFLATPAGVNLDAAERAVANAMRLAPEQADVQFVAGQVKFARANWKAARAHYERALALDPSHGGAMNELGRIRARRADSVGAARHFIRAARSAPDVPVYGRNVEAAIGGVMTLMMTALYIADSASLVLAGIVGVSPGIVVIFYLAAAALSAGYGAVQLWRMPPEMRPLLRSRRVVLALGSVYGGILVTMITVAATPARALFGALLVTLALILAFLFAAGAILRRKKDGTVGRGVTHDRAG